MLHTHQIPPHLVPKFWNNAEFENVNRLRGVIGLFLIASIANQIITVSFYNYSPIYLLTNLTFTILSCILILATFIIKMPKSATEITSTHHVITNLYVLIISLCAGIFAGIELRPNAALFFFVCGLIVPGVILNIKSFFLTICVLLNGILYTSLNLFYLQINDDLAFFYALLGFSTLIFIVSHRKRQLYIKQFLISLELEKHTADLESILTERTAELLAAKEKAEESDRLKSAFISNLNHELRTPLNGIMGFVSLLAESENLAPEKIKRYSKLIQANSAHLLKIISDILDIAKIQSNQITFKYEELTVESIIKGLHDFCETEIIKLNKTDIELKIEYSAPNLVIKTDAVRIQQILKNIASNSLKFTNTGHVKIGFTTERQNIIFTIEDTGIGIAHDKIESIFEPFRQGDDTFTRSHQGTGLGLAIAYKLVKMMNGDIFIKSELNKGSTITIILNQCLVEPKQTSPNQILHT